MNTVYRVVKNGYTAGRDGGYPMTTPFGPFFGTKKGAQDEADRMLRSMTPSVSKTVVHMVFKNERWSNDTAVKPVYEVEAFPVLTQAQADQRQADFVTEAQEALEAKIREHEAAAEQLRNKNAVLKQN